MPQRSTALQLVAPPAPSHYVKAIPHEFGLPQANSGVVIGDFRGFTEVSCGLLRANRGRRNRLWGEFASNFLRIRQTFVLEFRHCSPASSPSGEDCRGFPCRGAVRTIVFLDDKNVYQDARKAFYSSGDSHPHGQVSPIAFGNLLCSRRLPHMPKAEQRTLEQVRIYTGTPDPRKQPKMHAAHMRQRAAWESHARVDVIDRPLQYISGEPPKQKGVDVALAVDLVIHAVEGKYDLAIVASTDTDLLPAIEYILLKGKPVLEVASWWQKGEFEKQLRVAGGHLWCHRLTKDDYETVADLNDYNLGKGR